VSTVCSHIADPVKRRLVGDAYLKKLVKICD